MDQTCLVVGREFQEGFVAGEGGDERCFRGGVGVLAGVFEFGGEGLGARFAEVGRVGGWIVLGFECREDVLWVFFIVVVLGFGVWGWGCGCGGGGRGGREVGE